jgi:chromate reductase, NAD(P)H dehydrogenase (quinone)
MAEILKVVGLSGSLRRESVNTAVLRGLVQLAPEGMAIEPLDYHDVPVYNVDLGEVPAVERLKGRVAEADAVIIVSPEYNYGIPGPLKNVIDWLSRPGYQSVFAHKPVGTLSVAPGVIGGARGQAHLKLVLAAMVCQLFPTPEVAVGSAGSRLRERQIVDEGTRELLSRYLQQFDSWVRRVKIPSATQA